MTFGGDGATYIRAVSCFRVHAVHARRSNRIPETTTFALQFPFGVALAIALVVPTIVHVFLELLFHYWKAGLQIATNRSWVRLYRGQ